MKALNKTRDQLKLGVDYSESDQLIALDFNADADPDVDVMGIEIVVPSNSPIYVQDLCEEYCDELQDFLSAGGINRNIRHGEGIKFTDSSLGIIHTEPFFTDDLESMEAIRSNALSYCVLLRNTLGHIPGAIFILPHLEDDPGATASNGFNERDFAKYLLIPYLENMIAGKYSNMIGIT